MDEKNINKDKFQVIYSLPLGFRSKLQVVLNDYKCALSTVLLHMHNTMSQEEAEKLNKIICRLEEFLTMFEYSKLWDEAQ